MRIRHIRYTEALIEGGAASPRMYLFDHRQPCPDGVERSGHGSDMPYFFDNLDRAPVADGPHAEPLVRSMSRALVALARTGDPNHDAIPAWPPYNTTERATMVFAVEPHVEHDPMGAQRRVWEELAAPTGV
jgi:para-nitrobenzyl esterase